MFGIITTYWSFITVISWPDKSEEYWSLSASLQKSLLHGGFALIMACTNVHMIGDGGPFGSYIIYPDKPVIVFYMVSFIHMFILCHIMGKAKVLFPVCRPWIFYMTIHVFHKNVCQELHSANIFHHRGTSFRTLLLHPIPAHRALYTARNIPVYCEYSPVSRNLLLFQNAAWECKHQNKNQRKNTILFTALNDNTSMANLSC